MSNKIHDIWGRSLYHESRGQVLKWCLGDSEELFQQNLGQISRKALLEENGWLDREITYSFNEYGYRCDSFDLPCEALFAGCSETMGVAMPLDMLWSSRIAKHLDVPYHNIACGGADWQHNAQRLYYWLPRLKPKVVIIKEPPTERFNWWDQETVVSTCQFKAEELMSCKINQSRPLIDIISSHNSAWHRYSMLELIKQLCKENDANLIVIPTGKLNKLVDSKKDLARDLMHHGKKEQDYTVELVKKELKQIDI